MFDLQKALDVHDQHVVAKHLAAGIIFKGDVYLYLTEAGFFRGHVRLGTDSKTGEPTVRFYFSGNMERAPIIRKAFKLCSVDELEQAVKTLPAESQNRGYAFEKLVAEKWFNVTWKNDKSAFYERADVIDKAGNGWDVKLEGGTIIKASQVNRLAG